MYGKRCEQNVTYKLTIEFELIFPRNIYRLNRNLNNFIEFKSSLCQLDSAHWTRVD